MASSAAKTIKRKRNELTLSQRYAVIQGQNSGKGTRELARIYSCSTTQITWCIPHRDEIQHQFEQNVNSEAKRFRVATNQDINDEIFQWYEELAGKGLPINGKYFYFSANLW